MAFVIRPSASNTVHLGRLHLGLRGVGVGADAARRRAGPGCGFDQVKGPFVGRFRCPDGRIVRLVVDSLAAIFASLG